MRQFSILTTLCAAAALSACAGNPQPAPETPELPPAGADQRYSVELPQPPQQRPAIDIQLDLDESVARCDTDPAAFRFDSDQITPRDRAQLKALADCLNGAYFNSSAVRIIGRTDEEGSERYNRNLGLERAHTVRDWLVKFGVAPTRIQIATTGESQAEGDDSPPVTQAYDRRADIVQLGVVHAPH